MKKRVLKIINIMLIMLFTTTMFSSCSWDWLNIKHFEDWCKTNEDGYFYYYNEYSEEGVYILDIPDDEEVIIPEYIDDKRVEKLGTTDMGFGHLTKFYINCPNTKKLTIQHQFSVESHNENSFVDFSSLTSLTFIDFLYCNQVYSEEELIVPHYIGVKSSNVPTVELRKSNREYSLENFKAKVIIIPDYVKVIEKGVFDGLTNVVIKTSYESQPEGWEDGWNGTCEVEWGEEIKYLEYYDWIKTNEAGFTYYYNEWTDEGIYLLDVPKNENLVIPEYINGKKVIEISHIFDNRVFGLYGPYAKKLTIQHQFSYCKDIVHFRYLTNLIFIDYLYCNLITEQEELVVPFYIGVNDYYDKQIPIVELKKSNREYSLENFKAKVIIIPDYVKVIEKGVFDGLTNVVIKTSYESQPEGWEDGWNGTCEVEWGVKID